MATVNVDIKTEVKGLTDVQKLEKRIKALEANVTALNQKLPAAANGIRKTGRAAATASGNVQRLGIAFRTTLAPLTAVIGAVTLIGRSLGTVGSRQAELATLRNGLNGLVDDADAAAAALLEIADQAGKATLFNEEDFTATFKLFSSFRNIGVDAYERVGMAAADMAQIIGTGPKEAAMQLAKALEDPAKRVTDLARSGTVFTEQQKEQIKVLQQSGDLLGAQEIILKEIEAQYGGAAKAAGSAGFAGALDTLGEKFRDFQEALGASLEGSTVELFNAIGEGLDFITRNMDAAGAVFGAAVDLIKQPFIAILEGIKSVLGPIEQYEATWRKSIGVVVKVLQDFTNNVLVPVFRVLGVVIGKAIKWFYQFAQDVAKAMEGAARAVASGVRSMANAIAGFINATPVGALVKVFGGDAGQWATGGLTAWADTVESTIDGVKSYVADAAGMFAGGGGLDTALDPFAGAGPKGAAPGGGGGSGSGGKKGGGKGAGRESQVPALQRELTLARELEQLYGRIAEAELAGDQETVIRLRNEEELFKLKKEEADILAENIPEIEKQLKLELLGFEVRKQVLDTSYELKELEQARAEALEGVIRPIEDEIELLQAKINGNEEQIKQLQEIERLAIRIAKAQGRNDPNAADTAKATSLVTQRDELKAQAKQVQETEEMWKSLANTIESEIGSAMSSAIIGLIDGTKTAQEAFSDMFKNIGKAFIDMATQMIAKALVMKALGILQGAIGGGPAPAGGGGGSFFPLGQGFSFEGGGYTGDGPRSGGLDGRGGYLAMVHPQETIVDHHGAMGRYSGAGSSGGGGSRTIRFESTVINNVEYVTTEQAMAMSRQAADDGAKRGAAGGHARSMSTLKNSRSQRSKIGMR